MKARITFIALLLLCLNATCIFAKPSTNTATLKGIVVDANTNELLEFATAILQNPINNGIEQSVITNQKGEFILNNIKHGDYKLRVTFVGYNDFETTVKLSPDDNYVDLSSIKLESASTRLGAATVTSRAPIIERKMDMLVMNVEQAVSTAGDNALDILKKAPGVSVDKDGNIKLLGNSVLVQLDGRETRLSGAELAELLKGLDGGEISKIEIINSPSAKQDASGGGGIINIRTKKSSLKGFNGTANLGSQVYRKFGYNGGLSLNLRREKFGVYGSFNHRKNEWESNLIQTREFEKDNTSSMFRSDANLMGENYNNNYRGGIDFYINKKNTLGFLVTGNTNINNEKTNGFSENTTNGLTQNQSWADYKSKNKNNGVTFNTNYKTIFSEGHDLSFDLDYAKFNYKPNQDQNDFFSNTITGKDSTVLHNIKTPRNIEVYSAKTDYKKSLGEKTKLEVGAKISNSKTENSFVWQTNTNGSWHIDNNRTNDFEYTERVSAAYFSLGHQFSEKFSIKAGLRWENTYSKSYSPTTSEETKKNYADLFPTFFTQYKLNDKHDFTLSYNKRINRPGYWALNPFRTYTDAYTYIAGNQYLTPEYSHNLNLSHNLGNKVITTLLYRHTKDLITQVPQQKEGSIESGIIRDNFGYSNMAGISIAIPNYAITKWWTISMNSWGAWVQNHSIKDDNVYDDYSMMWQTNLTNNFTFAKTWKIEQGNYLSGPASWGYFKTETQYWSNIGVKKSFLDNKLDLSVNVDDPFRLSRLKGTVKYAHINNSYNEKGLMPNIRINLTWRFGSTKISNPNERKGGNADELNRIK